MSDFWGLRELHSANVVALRFEVPFILLHKPVSQKTPEVSGP